MARQMVSAVGDPIEAGREAVRRRAWEDAYELLSSADGRLAAEDLRGLGEAAFWSGRPDEAVAARERAYKAYLDEGDRLRAADIALRLAFDYFPKGNLPLFRGWLAKGERILEDEPESLEHGRAALTRAVQAGEIMGSSTRRSPRQSVHSTSASALATPPSRRWHSSPTAEAWSTWESWMPGSRCSTRHRPLR